VLKLNGSCLWRCSRSLPLAIVATLACFLVVTGCVNAKARSVDGGSYSVTRGNGEKRAILKKVQPDFPEHLVKDAAPGVINVIVTVEPDGHVSSAKAGQPAHPELSTLAESAVMQWMLAPVSDGKVERYQLPIRLSMEPAN
jgi:hypothetical protein